MNTPDVDAIGPHRPDSSMERRSAYDDALDVYFVLASRKATLEVENDRETLADDPEYRDLRDRIARVESRLDELHAGLTPAEAACVAASRAGAPGTAPILGIRARHRP